MNPKFVADVMLGRLARWLRIIGCDVYYCNTGEDSALLSKALAEKRILLTADRPLANRAKEQAFLIISDDFREQLFEIISSFEIEPNFDGDICPECNGQLIEVMRESVKDEVPEYTFATHENFRRCNTCAKIYWRGSHRELAEKELERILKRNVPKPLNNNVS